MNRLVRDVLYRTNGNRYIDFFLCYDRLSKNQTILWWICCVSFPLPRAKWAVSRLSGHCLYAWSITAVVRVFFLSVYFSYNGFHSFNMFDKNCTLSLPIPTLSANLYDQSYYAYVCGYPIHALKLLACTLKLLPCTVKLLPCTVK